MRVKICGITNRGDALAAADAGADAVGLNFVGGPRRIDPARAGEILAALPPFVTAVALVSIEAGRLPGELTALLAAYRPHLQLYGAISGDVLARLAGEGYIALPVLRVGGADFWRELRELRPAAGVVLDAFHADQQGGTGSTFPWEWVAAAREHGQLAEVPSIVLAGGLRPDNVAEAIRIVQPYGVDVSSGVEVEGAPGRKDPVKMRAFVQAAKGGL